MNIQRQINKLITAIRTKGIDIKIDKIESYSGKLQKYIVINKVFIRMLKKNKRGEVEEKYVLQDTFFSKVKLLEYLVEKYKEIGSEANG